IPIPTSAPGEPDIRGLGRSLWRNKLRIIGFTLIVTAAAFVVVNSVTPRYRSEARILLEAKENVFLRAEADKQPERATVDAEAVTSQAQIVLSRDLAREVIRNTKLADKPEFNSALGGESIGKMLLSLIGIGPSAMTQDERVLDAYHNRLSVVAVEKSRVIS